MWSFWSLVLTCKCICLLLSGLAVSVNWFPAPPNRHFTTHLAYDQDPGLPRGYPEIHRNSNLPPGSPKASKMLPRRSIVGILVPFLLPNGVQNRSHVDIPRILKTMLSCTRELHFHILGTSRMESKLDPESGCRKTSHFWCLKVQKLPQGAQRLPKGSPKRSQQTSKIYQKSTKILPEATPDAQGYPKGVKCTISGHPGVHFGTILDKNANKSWASDLKLSR